MHLVLATQRPGAHADAGPSVTTVGWTDLGRPPGRGTPDGGESDAETDLAVLVDAIRSAAQAAGVAGVAGVAGTPQNVADGYGRTYRTTPPVAFLASITQDLTELRGMTGRRLLSSQRRGLCNATCRMAGLLATTLINLGDYREARAWFHTATRAAEESEDTALRAWVLVRHAVSALYWGDPCGAVDLAAQAEMLTQHEPCIAAAWAPAVRARALAQMSQTEAARVALAEAEQAFDRMEIRSQEQYAYGYTAAQLHFYRGNTSPPSVTAPPTTRKTSPSTTTGPANTSTPASSASTAPCASRATAESKRPPTTPASSSPTYLLIIARPSFSAAPANSPQPSRTSVAPRLPSRNFGRFLP